MILSLLPSILGARRLRISKVSEDTGISRTTLTALYYDTGKGIQFDTLNVLCNYLNVEIGELLLILPFDITPVSVFYDGTHSRTSEEDTVQCHIVMEYSDKWTKNRNFNLNLEVVLSKTEYGSAYRVSVRMLPESPDDILSDFLNESVRDIIKKLGFEGQKKVGDMVFQKLIDEIFCKREDKLDFAPLLTDFTLNIDFAEER